MRFSRRILLFLLASFCLAATALAQGKFHLRDGDTVVFYGDSITDQRLYTTFAESYVLTRFPHLRIRFVHSGVGGDRVTSGWAGPIDLRLSRDVEAYQPTVMTIMLGMNDGSYRAWDDAIFKTYSTGYEHIIDFMKKAVPELRITVIQPSPFDDVTRPPTFEGGYNAVLVRYAQFVRQLGEHNSLVVADFNAPVVDMLKKAKAADPDLAKKIIEDRVHPGEGGHLIMAEALLKAWNAPSTVASVEIDAASTRVVHAEQTKVTELRAAQDLSWTETDEALPLPLPQPLDSINKEFALAVRSSDFVEALDQEPLKVTGLAASRYVLTIDGEKTGDFTKEEYERGINLAVLPTPMVKQAAKLHDLTLKHNDIHFARWRHIQMALQDLNFSHEQAAVDALDRLEDEIVQQQRAAAQPKTRHFVLAPQ
jgi:lysophospholipase L1-like esterase